MCERQLEQMVDTVWCMSVYTVLDQSGESGEEEEEETRCKFPGLSLSREFCPMKSY